MKIEFNRLEIQNFKSVSKKIVFNYTDFHGLTFVYGKNYDVPGSKNGTGKSTILCDALAFALFGKTMKSTSNRYLPNRFCNSGLKTSCKLFFKSDNTLYSIESFGKVVGKGMTTVATELLRLNPDETVAEDLTQSTAQKTRQYIQENLIGCNFEVFKSSVLVSATDFMNFYEGMAKEQKRKYVENVLSMQNFGEMFRMTKTDLNDLKKDIVSGRREILKLNDGIKNIQSQFDEHEQEQKNKRNVLDANLLKFTDAKKKLEESLKLLPVVDEMEIKKEIASLNTTEKELADAMHKLDKAKSKNELELKHIENDLEKAEKMGSGLCEKCKAIVDERMNVSETLAKKKKCDEQILLISDRMSSALKRQNDTQIRIAEKQEILDGMSDTMKKRSTIESKLCVVTNEINHIMSEINELDNKKTNPFGTILENYNKDLAASNKRLDEMLFREKMLTILKEACSENGVKKFVMKDIVTILNSQIQKYLNEIGCEFFVCFDETFDFRFITTSGECEFSSFSAGERQRIQMATMLAFRDLIMSWKIESNIFIIDEMIDANVDTICIENVMNILKRKVSESGQNVFVISHRSELADNESVWDNIVKVSKQNGESSFVIK